MMRLPLLGACLAFGMGSASHAAITFADLSFVGVKQQTGTSTSTDLGSFVAIRAFVDNTGDYNKITVTLPSGVDQALTAVGGANGYFYFSTPLEDRATLLATYGHGTYSIVGQSATGNEYYPLYNIADAFIPNYPIVSNYARLGKIKPGADLSINLAHGFTRPTNSGSAYTFVNLFDLTNAGQFVDSINLLDPSTTNFMVPYALLTPSHVYRAEITFDSRVVPYGASYIPPESVLFDNRTSVDFTYNPTTSSVPEPMTWMMIGCGFGVIGLTRRQGRQSARA